MKKNFKRFLGIIILVFGAYSLHILAQPLTGNYTVGGNAPDFATLQDAAHALFINGMSGPVNINIRPGTYYREISPGPVLVLDSVITGLSAINRLTFQSDIASGGNVDNVILKIDCDSSTNLYNDREIAYIRCDYIVFRNLTFVDADSMDSPAVYLIRLAGFSQNPSIDGFEIEGCKFFGSPYYDQGNNGEFGTTYGIEGENLITSSVISCQFLNFNNAVSLDVYTPTADSVIIENNRFEHLFPVSSNTGAINGGAIYTNFTKTYVRGNFVTNSAGRNGIQVESPVTGVIEGNYITGNFWSGQLFIEGYNVTDSIVVKNNIIIGASDYGAIYLTTSNSKILNNTIDNISNSGLTLYLSGAQCSVINNIILDFNTNTTFRIDNNATDVISDHNVFYRSETVGYFAQIGGTYYTTFDDYRIATGKDPNSNFTNVEFEFDSLGIHLDECQAQDSRLNGIPLPEVQTDYYGAIRDSVKPFVGAVEGVRLPFDMFGDPYRTSLQGFATSIAEGIFDNSSGPGLAVPDYDNSAIYLFRNNGTTRTFTNYATIYPGYRPIAVYFYDVDADGNLDLVVGGDTSSASLKVYWGDGSGGFSSPTTVETIGRVRAIHSGHATFSNLNTVVFTEDNGFLPNSSFVGYLDNSNGRNLIHDRVTKHINGVGDVPDTIYSVLEEFAVGDLNGDGSDELGIIANSPTPLFYVFSDTSFGNFDWGHHFSFLSNSASYTNGAVVLDDFDGDGDKDFITTGGNDNLCILLRNNSGLSFSIDSITSAASRGIVKLDYENDGDMDFVTINNSVDSLGITVFLNDGAGNFTEQRNCFLPFASGQPFGVSAADFDLDGKTDIALVTRSLGGFDSLFVLYNLGGFNGTTGIKPQIKENEIPEKFELSQNYPNPFNPNTRIKYSVPSASNVKIYIYNILGQRVKELVNNQVSAGTHIINFNTNNLASGVYVYTIEAKILSGKGNFVSAKKMILLK